MANDAYKLKADASFPRAIRKVEDLADGTPVYETVGENYAAGQYVLASELHPRDKERAENGDLDHLLEPVSLDEAQEAREAGRIQGQRSVFIAEHEAEAVALEDYGHTVVPRDQVLEMKSAGAETAKEALTAAHDAGTDVRPGLRGHDAPSLAQAAAEGVLPVVETSGDERVPDDALVGVEQPPGHPVGPDLEEAEGGPEVSKKPRRERRSTRGKGKTKQEKGDDEEKSE